MGLDMYAYSCPKKYRKNSLEVFREEMEKDNVSFDNFFYWRKNRHLHNWMEQLYIEKGGEEEFNCVIVELTLEDLDQLEKDLMSFKVQNMGSPGFFFGNQDYDPAQLAEDLDFVEEARNKINKGDCVFYDSWW